MTSERFLIVNADDFGQSVGVNQGIIAAHERGIVTSASLMVRWFDAASAAAYARAHPGLSVGLHLDLGEWKFTGEYWEPRYFVVDVDDDESVGREVSSQLNRFLELIGRSPSHIDSHQHAHRQEPVRGHVLRAAERLEIPVREQTAGPAYCGAYYGQDGKGDAYPDGITVQGLLQLLETLPAGWTELGCHPGDGSDMDSSYVTERAIETAALCDARIREAISHLGIRLCSFWDWRQSGSATPIAVA